MWELGASGYVNKNDGCDILKQALVDAFKPDLNLSDGFQVACKYPCKNRHQSQHDGELWFFSLW